MKDETGLIALVPDRFALYRYPVFKLISRDCSEGSGIVIYADPREDASRIKLAPPEFCNTDVASGGVRWKRIRSIYWKHICFWQTGLVKLGLHSRYRVVVYWGEAHRISTWISALLARLTRKKVVFWTHGIYGNEGLFKRTLRTWFYRLGHAVLLYGAHGKAQLVTAGFPAERLFVINNSLDVASQRSVVDSLDSDLLRSLRRRFAPESARLLVFVGRLERGKRLDMLLRAVSLLKSNSIDVRALLIGDGSMRADLEKLAEDLRVTDQVCFYGKCYDDREVLPLIAASDVCVSPGEVGLTAMHSLVCGTPVISHNDFSHQMPECEAIRPGQSGFLFRRDDLGDLVDKICICLSDIDSGKITAETCREVVESYYTPEYQSSVFNEAVRPLLN